MDEALVSYRWFSNHFSHLVTKLAAMEFAYPHTFAGRCLTPDWLMLQMKYRYDREIDRAEHLAIHKICERDAAPSLRMVLYVSKYCPPLAVVSHDHTRLSSDASMQVDGGAGHRTGVPHPPPPTMTSSIEVSDGWYNLPCGLDTPPFAHDAPKRWRRADSSRHEDHVAWSGAAEPSLSLSSSGHSLLLVPQTLSQLHQQGPLGCQARLPANAQGLLSHWLLCLGEGI